MLRFFRYITGYLQIRVGGFAPERFMNLCSKRNIVLWDIRKDKTEYFMCIRLHDFYLLKPVVHKTKTRVVVLKRIGLPFFIPLLRQRKIFVAGIVFSLLFWGLQSFFVWDIKVEGNYRITQDQVLTFLQEQGVKCGILKKSLDIEKMEKEIRREFPFITWTSARLDGTKLKISIKENEVSAAKTQKEGPKATDLVSKYQGQIVSIIVRSGVPLVKRGDCVEPGMVLVDGKVPIYADDGTVKEYLLTKADADILIEHEMTKVWRLQKDYQTMEYTGRSIKTFYLQIGDRLEFKKNKRIPYPDYDILMEKKTWNICYRLKLPVWFGQYTYREYFLCEREYSKKEAEQYLNEKLLIFLKSLTQKGVQIIEKNVRIDISGEDYVLECSFLLREEAGLEKATDIGESLLE